MPVTDTGLKRILQILLVHSAKDLFKYKSFFLLIFVLMLIDRVLKKVVQVDRSTIQLQQISRFTLESAVYTFEKLPHDLWRLLTDYRTFLILAGLFFLKQIVSLWPSSDMRRMHRNERSAFGLFHSLAVIRWEQVVWDAIAVSTICGLFAIWAGCGYAVLRILWQSHQNVIWLIIFIGYASLFTPMVMAGFSFSSKLAVISRGTFGHKLGLYFHLFYNRQVLWPSWFFFGVRIAIELVFVVIIPVMVLLLVEIFWLRILTATLIATPVYSYLKMASFKFFLEVYRPFPLVGQEYADYYAHIMGSHLKY